MVGYVVRNSYGEALYGELLGDLGDRLVIICHGLAENKRIPLLQQVALLIRDCRYSVFLFDFSGNGDSEGFFEDATYHKEVDDLLSVINHFKSNGVKHFVLIGHSMGGGVVKVVASKVKVCGVIDLAGVSKADSFKEKFPDLVREIEHSGVAFFMEGCFGRRFPLTKKYLSSALSINVIGAASSISCPVLFIVGDNDSLLRIENAKEFLELIPADLKALSRIVVLNGVDHFFNQNLDDFEEVIDRLRSLIPDFLHLSFSYCR